jgi:thiol-disulfide isomerase/thioredoxin
MTFKKDLILLLKPYYWVNLLLSFSYLLAKRCPIVCNHLAVYLFPNREEVCELDSRETEILFFLIIVVMIRTRKAGSVTMINYMTSSFIYTKVANIILWFYADTLYGIVFSVVFILVGLLLPEPTYSGPENIVYFRTANGLADELDKDKRVNWLVVFYTVWNPACVNFAPIFAQLSAEYHLDNLKFGKIDIGRFPEVGARHHVSGK